MNIINTEEQLKDKDFFISQDGIFYGVSSGNTLEDFAQQHLENELDDKGLPKESAMDYLVNFLGYVGYKHVGDEVTIIKPKYELYGMKMSDIQKKKLIDFVMYVDTSCSAMLALLDTLELDSDDCSLEMHKRR